jgi:hypothetical protein
MILIRVGSFIVDRLALRSERSVIRRHSIFIRTVHTVNHSILKRSQCESGKSGSSRISAILVVLNSHYLENMTDSVYQRLSAAKET